MKTIKYKSGINKKLVGLKAFDAASKRKSKFNPNKTIKELYDESISKKY